MAGLSATSSWKTNCSPWPAKSGSAPSLAASTSRSTSASSACRVTALRAPSASAFPARRTAKPRRKSPRTEFFSKSWRKIPAVSSPRNSATGNSRGCRSISTSEWRKPSKPSRNTPSPPHSRSAAPSSSPATSPTRSSRKSSKKQANSRNISGNTRFTTPARPKPRQACHPAPSARPPPGEWTATSIFSKPTAARWSCWPRATARNKSPTPARATAVSTSARPADPLRCLPKSTSARRKSSHSPNSAWKRSGKSPWKTSRRSSSSTTRATTFSPR